MDMKKFIEKNSEQIIGSLSCADRLIFKDYLPFYNGESMQHFLSARGIFFKDLKPFLIKQSNKIKEHAQGMARRMGRPFEYLISLCLQNRLQDNLFGSGL
jgi:hypothetical protein